MKAQIMTNLVIRISPALAHWIATRLEHGDTPSKVLERELEIERAPDGRRKPCPCGRMTIDDCAGECGEPARRAAQASQ